MGLAVGLETVVMGWRSRDGAKTDYKVARGGAGKG